MILESQLVYEDEELTVDDLDRLEALGRTTVPQPIAPWMIRALVAEARAARQLRADLEDAEDWARLRAQELAFALMRDMP